MVDRAPVLSRLLLRGDATAMKRAGSVFGVAPPGTACRVNSTPPRHALWLGPDECLLLLPEPERDAALADLTTALAATPHSLVDISHRQDRLIVEGCASENLLNAGCPLDLDQAIFPVGACTRTVLGKAEIVLWRTGSSAFHLEVARSYVPYVREFLRQAGK